MISDLFLVRKSGWRWLYLVIEICNKEKRSLTLSTEGLKVLSTLKTLNLTAKKEISVTNKHVQKVQKTKT